jgi:hypothetical protein
MKLEKNYRQIISFIKKLQRSPEPIKKRWLLVFSAFSMIFIISLWLIYLNSSLPSITKTNEKVAREEDGFTYIMGRGFKKVKNDFAEQWSAFRSQLSRGLNDIKKQLEAKKDVVIPQQFEYIPPQLEEETTSTLIR